MFCWNAKFIRRKILKEQAKITLKRIYHANRQARKNDDNNNNEKNKYKLPTMTCYPRNM